MSRCLGRGPVRRAGTGYLLFENPGSGANQQLVDGPCWGPAGRDRGAGAGAQRLPVGLCRGPDRSRRPADAELRRRRTTGSGRTGRWPLEVADAGVPGVVAMRYNVYVVTAAQFVADLYTALLAGQTLGRGGRPRPGGSWRRRPVPRASRSSRWPLQDWSVPIVYEAAPLPLFTPPAEQRAARITIADADGRHAPRRDAGCPRPDVGFFGRDETLLALDRAFDSRSGRVAARLRRGGQDQPRRRSSPAGMPRTGGLATDDGWPGLVVWT